MKALPWILSLVIMLALTVHPAEISDADLDKISHEDIIKTVQHLQQRAVAAEESNGKTIGALQQVTRENGEIAAQLAKADASAKELETELAKSMAYGTQEHERGNKMEVRAVKAEKRAVICTVIAGVAMLACAAMGYLLFKP